MTSLPGHFLSSEVRDVIFCHVTASSCDIQPCRKWNVHYTPLFGLLQPLPGDFRSNDVTSASLPVTWAHVTSFPVRWLPPSASYSLAGREMYSIRQFSAFNSHFQMTSGQMTSLPGHFLSPEVRDAFSVTWLLRHATYSPLGNEMYTISQFWHSTATFRRHPVKWRHFRVTSGHLRSRDVICCHVTSSSCELQPCRKRNVPYTPVFGLLSHFQVTSGQLKSLPGNFRSSEITDVTSCHLTASSCELQPCTKWNVL